MTASTCAVSAFRPRNHAILVVVVGRKVQIGADRERGIVADERRRDVGQVLIVDRVGPEVVELGLEARDDGRIVGEVHGLVHVVGVRNHRRVRTVGEVRGGELHLRLARVEHHLPMVDAGGHLVPDGNAGGDERLAYARVGWVIRVGPRVENDAHGHTGLPAFDDFRRVARVGHEPERDIETNVLVTDQLKNRGAAIFIGVVTQSLLRRRTC